MASGRAVVVSVVAVAALGALALIAGTASAKPKRGGGGGGGGGDEEDMHSPEACAAYKAERDTAFAHRDSIKGDMVDVDAQLMSAYQDGADQATVLQLLAAKTGMQQQINALDQQIAELHTLIAGCP